MQNNDDRKNVVMEEYRNQTDCEVASRDRLNPSLKAMQQNENFICCVCGEEHSENETNQFEIKGKTKNICQGCADIVHGLV